MAYKATNRGLLSSATSETSYANPSLMEWKNLVAIGRNFATGSPYISGMRVVLPVGAPLKLDQCQTIF